MRPEAYRRYLLALLTTILTFNFVDRLALGVVLDDIKRDLHLSDTELGVLSGIAFALFYSVMGIPIARWADRGNRVRIISLTAALWSVAVALCGIASSFLQLMMIRIWVAIGEAGAFAPGLSLIADYFRRSERPRAVAIYSLAGSLSALLGYFLAGWFSQLFGWRVMFFLIGIPGVVLGVVARLTLREPRQKATILASRAAGPPLVDTEVAATHSQATLPSSKEVFITLWRSATFRHLLLCTSAMFFFIYGILQWQPTFFIRSYSLTSAEVGTAFAIVYGVTGIFGTYVGGELASRYATDDERLQLLAIAIVIAVSGLLSAFIYLSPNYTVACWIMAVSSILQAAVNGPLFATIQTLVPERMRAVAMALVLLFANMIGMGLGPLATGVLSDVLRPLFGDESLRYALFLMSPGYLWVAWHAWCASRSVTTDLQRAGSSHGDASCLADESGSPETTERTERTARI